MSFDFPGLGGRRGDPWDRFLLFVEQLEQAIGLLESGRVARQRMALVALDTLAEGLLFRHMETVFLASDEPTWIEHRTFPSRERRAARERFNKRVAIAAEKLDSVSPVYYPDRIVDEHDAVLFRVAHHYRNSVHHQDRHNPTLIHPVGRLYAQAVGRAFVHSHRRGWAIHSSPSFMKEIARLGWRGRSDGYFDPREAAKAIMPRICQPLTELQHQQWVHLFGPDREITTRVDLESHNRIRKKGKRLRNWRGTEVRLLEAYQKLDDQLQVLEAAIDFMMSETDRRAWAEEDLARGR